MMLRIFTALLISLSLISGSAFAGAKEEHKERAKHEKAHISKIEGHTKNIDKKMRILGKAFMEARAKLTRAENSEFLLKDGGKEQKKALEEYENALSKERKAQVKPWENLNKLYNALDISKQSREDDMLSVGIATDAFANSTTYYPDVSKIEKKSFNEAGPELAQLKVKLSEDRAKKVKQYHALQEKLPTDPNAAAASPTRAAMDILQNGIKKDLELEIFVETALSNVLLPVAREFSAVVQISQGQYQPGSMASGDRSLPTSASLQGTYGDAFQDQSSSGVYAAAPVNGGVYAPAPVNGGVYAPAPVNGGVYAPAPARDLSAELTARNQHAAIYYEPLPADPAI